MRARAIRSLAAASVASANLILSTWTISKASSVRTSQRAPGSAWQRGQATAIGLMATDSEISSTVRSIQSRGWFHSAASGRGLLRAAPCAKLAFMEKRLRVMKWLGPIPAIAVCEGCGREFKVPLSVLAKTAGAQAYLQEQFQRHKCETRVSGEDANRSA